jgi:hypothetical protein
MNNGKLAGYGKALLEAASELPLVSELPSVLIKTNKKTISIVLYEGITVAVVKENEKRREERENLHTSL